MKNPCLAGDISRVLAATVLILLVFLMAQPALAADVFYTNDRVNLRTGPGTDYDRLKVLPIGIAVEVLEHVPEEWSKVAYKDMIGYIKSEFLDTVKPENAPEISTDGVLLMEWREARNIVAVGARLTIYDLYSGSTYYIKSFSNGMHADVEPITPEDTAIMKSTFGSWTWDPRPVLVTVGDTTIAASINGMPHGGGVNANNGINGQFCLHFLNSTVHNGNMRYNSDMQSAVRQAFSMCE